MKNYPNILGIIIRHYKDPILTNQDSMESSKGVFFVGSNGLKLIGFTGGEGVGPVGLKDLILFESVVRKGLDYTTPIQLLLFQDGIGTQNILLRGSGYWM